MTFRAATFFRLHVQNFARCGFAIPQITEYVVEDHAWSCVRNVFGLPQVVLRLTRMAMMISEETTRLQKSAVGVSQPPGLQRGLKPGVDETYQSHYIR